MTECIGSPAQEMAEQYLSGELQGPEAEQFENHFFACELCHEQLRTLMDVRDALIAGDLSHPAAAASLPEPLQILPRQVLPRKRLGARILAFPVPVAVLGSLAAMLLVVAVLVGVQRSSLISSNGSANASSPAQAPVPQQDQASIAAPQQAAAPIKSSAPSAATTESSTPLTSATQPETELASLADLHLPGYQAPQLRGEDATDSSHVAFVAGMQAYSGGDCSQAIDSLAKVSASATDGIAAKLYSGLCQLESRELDHAEASFNEVNAAGDTPELETAEYYLAQTRLLHGDATGAKKWLNRTVALHGDYEERAQKQIAKLSH